jgi:PKD repeat protein
MKIVKILLALGTILLCLQIFAYATEQTSHSEATEPVVKIVATPNFGTAPLTVSFDASNFLYHYGNKLSFSWDFNDGSTASGVTTTHTFNRIGTYTVTLEVTTPFGPKTAWVIIIVS